MASRAGGLRSLSGVVCGRAPSGMSLRGRRLRNGGEIAERQKINDGRIFMTHRKTIFFLPILISLPEASVATRRGTSLGSGLGLVGLGPTFGSQ